MGIEDILYDKSTIKEQYVLNKQGFGYEKKEILSEEFVEKIKTRDYTAAFNILSKNTEMKSLLNTTKSALFVQFPVLIENKKFYVKCQSKENFYKTLQNLVLLDEYLLKNYSIFDDLQEKITKISYIKTPVGIKFFENDKQIKISIYKYYQQIKNKTRLNFFDLFSEQEKFESVFSKFGFNPEVSIILVFIHLRSDILKNVDKIFQSEEEQQQQQQQQQKNITITENKLKYLIVLTTLSLLYKFDRVLVENINEKSFNFVALSFYKILEISFLSSFGVNNLQRYDILIHFLYSSFFLIKSNPYDDNDIDKLLKDEFNKSINNKNYAFYIVVIKIFQKIRQDNKSSFTDNSYGEKYFPLWLEKNKDRKDEYIDPFRKYLDIIFKVYDLLEYDKLEGNEIYERFKIIENFLKFYKKSIIKNYNNKNGTITINEVPKVLVKYKT